MIAMTLRANNMENSMIGVITGDIVNSRQIPVEEYDSMLYRLHQTLESFSERYEMHFDVFRGDEFQLLLKRPEKVIYLATIIRLSLKSGSTNIDVRQSLSVGDSNELRDDVKSSTGEAFVLSGQNLNKMKSELLIFDSTNELLKHHLGSTIELLDAHLSSLTKTEAYVLMSYLGDPEVSHAELAKEIGKSRPNTTKMLNSAHYNSVLKYLYYAENLIIEARE